MEKKLKIDPKKVEFDGNSIRLIVPDESALFERLKKKQAEILSDLEKSEKEQINSNNSDQAAKSPTKDADL